MCGIAGFCNGDPDSERIIRCMTDQIKHRGPDADGFWLAKDRSVILGHRRLSIIDISPTGAQPMVSHSGNTVIAFNGEIYNHRELLSKINDKGIEPRGTSDTEVLLEHFELFGIDETLNSIRGMYAIALYSLKEKQLYLIRDRAGEKPLYYGFAGGRLYFSSDLVCIASVTDLDIDSASVELYFRRGYIPAPYSIYKGIYKLEPGHYIRFKTPFREGEDVTYWSCFDRYQAGIDNPFRGTIEDASEQLEYLLRRSIRNQMISDVPLGAFLSAGIDSSTIVSLMQQESDKSVKTFTVGVDEPDYNEAEIAAKTAKILGTDHVEEYISTAQMKKIIPKLGSIYTEPFADSSQIPTILISKVAKRDVTVVLSGDAGDELFCGYERYNGWVTNAWKKQQSLPLGVQHFRGYFRKLRGKDYRSTDLKRLMSSSLSQTYAAVSSSDTSFVYCKNLYSDRFESITRSEGFTEQDILMLMDFDMYLSDDILVKVDRAAMSQSLETRIPFLDNEVIEFAWSLPLNYKYRDGVTKRVLRNILYKYIPKELMERPKTGFSIPLNKWLREGDLMEWADNLIDQAGNDLCTFVDTNVIKEMWIDYIDNNKWNESLWNALVFFDWYRETKKKVYS